MLPSWRHHLFLLLGYISVLAVALTCKGGVSSNGKSGDYSSGQCVASAYGTQNGPAYCVRASMPAYFNANKEQTVVMKGCSTVLDFDCAAGPGCFNNQMIMGLYRGTVCCCNDKDNCNASASASIGAVALAATAVLIYLQASF